MFVLRLDKSLFLLAIGVCSILPGCWWSGQKTEQQYSHMRIINVLDKNLYNDCHIIGSVQVDLEDLEAYASKLDKKIEIIVYCSNYYCTGSGAAAQQLQDMGFANVWAYEAGMAEWFQKGLPCVGKAQSPYLKKVVAQPSTGHDSAVRIITTEELAQKLGVTKE